MARGFFIYSNVFLQIILVKVISACHLIFAPRVKTYVSFTSNQSEQCCFQFLPAGSFTGYYCRGLVVFLTVVTHLLAPKEKLLTSCRTLPVVLKAMVMPASQWPLNIF